MYNINYKGLPPERRLKLATISCDVSEIRKLLSEGVNINQPVDSQDLYGKPIKSKPLTIISSIPSIYCSEVAEILIENGADVNDIDPFNKERKNTPLLMAIPNFHNLELVKLLLEAGADPNYENAEGITPLRLACGNGDIEIINLLVAAGADLNKKFKTKKGSKTIVELAKEGLLSEEINDVILEIAKKTERAANVSLAFRGKFQNNQGAPLFPETDINPAGRLPGVAANLIAEFNTGLTRVRPRFNASSKNTSAAAGGHGGGRRKIRKTKKGKKGTRRR